MVGPVLPVVEKEGAVRLLGCRCRNCGECFYPPREVCDNCGSGEWEAREFGPEGVLYTYTIVREPPGQPPRAFGQVEFEGRVRVQARIVSDALDRIRIGVRMEAGVPPRGEGGDFVFQPVEAR